MPFPRISLVKNKPSEDDVVIVVSKLTSNRLMSDKSPRSSQNDISDLTLNLG